MAKEPTKRPRTRRKFELGKMLNRQVQLPVGGYLGKTVMEPRWMGAIREYLVGSWTELRQVQWPDRRSSISLTLAVLMFTFVVIAFTLAADSLFEQLFKGVIIK